MSLQEGGTSSQITNWALGRVPKKEPVEKKKVKSESVIFLVAQLLISSSWRDIFQVSSKSVACLQFLGFAESAAQEDFLRRQLEGRAVMQNQSCMERRGKWKQKSRKRGQKYEKNLIYSTIPRLGIWSLVFPPAPLTRACNKEFFSQSVK